MAKYPNLKKISCEETTLTNGNATYKLTISYKENGRDETKSFTIEKKTPILIQKENSTYVLLTKKHVPKRQSPPIFLYRGVAVKGDVSSKGLDISIVNRKKKEIWDMRIIGGSDIRDGFSSQPLRFGLMTPSVIKAVKKTSKSNWEIEIIKQAK